MAKMGFYKVLQSNLEPILLHLGFKLISKSGGAIITVDTKMGLKKV